MALKISKNDDSSNSRVQREKEVGVMEAGESGNQMTCGIVAVMTRD